MKVPSEQMTIDEVLNQCDKKCANCQYWTLLPLAEQREGWGIKGQCDIAISENWGCKDTSEWTSCHKFKPAEEEPEWKKSLWSAMNTGYMIYIKEKILEIEIDLWDKKIYDKFGMEIKGFEHTFKH